MPAGTLATGWTVKERFAPAFMLVKDVVDNWKRLEPVPDSATVRLPEAVLPVFSTLTDCAEGRVV